MRTHAYAAFSSMEEAEATCQALNDVEWPEGRQNRLQLKCATGAPFESASPLIFISSLLELNAVESAVSSPKVPEL